MEDGDTILAKSFLDAFCFLQPYLKFSEPLVQLTWGFVHCINTCCELGTVLGTRGTMANNVHLYS